MKPSAHPFLWKWVLFAREWKIISISRLSTWPRFHTEARGNSEMAYCRLQNSPFFLRIQVGANNETKGLERGWNRRVRLRSFFLSPHTPYRRVRLARFACVRLWRHALPISLLILRKKLTVLQSRPIVFCCHFLPLLVHESIATAECCCKWSSLK